MIQPFDNKGAFDKRYDGVFKPAIETAGLQPYRVDRDPKGNILIEDIENGIRSAVVCLADITLDNPNVWFELGYAIASRIEVILVCSSERKTAFPFDVQHRKITRYSPESPQDFRELKEAIAVRIEAVLKKGESLAKVASSPLADVEGLNQTELIALASIAESLGTPSDTASAYLIHQDVEANGFTRMASLIGLRSLVEKEFIKDVELEEHIGEPYTAYSITDRGWAWIVKHQDKFAVRKPLEDWSPPKKDDEIPF